MARTEIVIRLVVEGDPESTAATIRKCLGDDVHVEVFTGDLWQEAYGSGLDDAVRMGYTKRNRRRNQVGTNHVVAQAEMSGVGPEQEAREC